MGAKKASPLSARRRVWCLAFCISEAKAQDLQSVQSQIDDLKATIEELQKQVADAKAQAAAAKSAAEIPARVIST